MFKNPRRSLLSALVSIAVSFPVSGNPSLTPGVWKDITPPGLDLTGTSSAPAYGVNDIEFDPNNPSILYTCVDQNGMLKSTDGGSTWAMMGSKPTSCNYGSATTFLDSPLHLRIDPKNSLHMYCAEGVRGCTQGFWVTTDGGASWNIPASFLSLSQSTTGLDIYCCSVDPSDFNHILVTYHGWWKTPNDGNTGVLESTDGGNSWKVHFQTGWGTGNCAWFLGDSKTWLLGSQGSGFWRTADSGATWAHVFTTANMMHGGTQLYHSAVTGYYYNGAFDYPIRSTDGGQTWQQLTNGLTYSAYYSVWGDGDSLFTQQATTGMLNAGATYMVSSETDGVRWTQYHGGTQTFGNGPYNMTYDAVNHIMYSANWSAGIWALKTGTTNTRCESVAASRKGNSSANARITTLAEYRKSSAANLANTKSVGLYDLRGGVIGRAGVGVHGGAKTTGGTEDQIAVLKALN